MEFHQEFTQVALALFILLLVCAAIFDTLKFIIPNMVCVALVVLFFATAALAPGKVDWVSHLAAAGLVLVVGFGIYLGNFMGAGDIKLLTAVALWAGLSELPMILAYIGLFGGALAIFLMFARRFTFMVLVNLPKTESLHLPKVLLKGEAIPYGVGIAIGAIWLSGLLPLFAIS